MKIFIFTLLLLMGRPSFAQSVYGRYMQPVKTVLARMNGSASFEKVCDLMRLGHGFRYKTEGLYVATAPAITEAMQSGDCKAKALWLAAELNDTSVCFVVGMLHSNSKTNHAWLVWRGQWILDCTNTRWPIPISDIHTGRDYIPVLELER